MQLPAEQVFIEKKYIHIKDALQPGWNKNRREPVKEPADFHGQRVASHIILSLANGLLEEYENFQPKYSKGESWKPWDPAFIYGFLKALKQ